MRDCDVRECVWRWLDATHANDPDTLMLNELGISSGATRIDIAVINGQMEGFELKSARDTLERLPIQRDLYNQVFDRVNLVVAECHLVAADKIIPHWWGVYVASMWSGKVKVTADRLPEPNPSLEAETVASLLWRDEAIAVLQKHSAARGVISKPREAVYARLSQVLDLKTLCFEVRSALKARKGWRVDRRSQRYGD